MILPRFRSAAPKDKDFEEEPAPERSSFMQAADVIEVSHSLTFKKRYPNISRY